MGCGTSRGRTLVTPLSNGTKISHPTWQENGNYKTVLIKEYNHLNQVSVGVQTEHLCDLRERACQTDVHMIFEDELESILAIVNSIQGNGITDVQTQTEELDTITIERGQRKVNVGIQVSNSTVNRSTQTTKGEKKLMLPTADFESQTDPVTRALAANAADSDVSVLFSVDTPSPIAHIEKELNGLMGHDHAVTGSIARLLQDIEDDFDEETTEKKEAAVQTDNDPITDEAPEFAARAPPCKKEEMIPTMSVFDEIDKHALEAPESVRSSLQTLVNYLTSTTDNDLLKVRALFRWISNNITYDYKYLGTKMTADEVLEKGEGVCKDYSKLFNEMCKLANIRVKRLQGFAKGYDYRPGHKFLPDEDITHAWNAVYIFGAWRLIDTTWGSGYTDYTGKFQRKLNEHFFLPDPEILIWTHFPYDEMEKNYSRWQLLEKPLTLEEFNSLPKVTPHFFQFHLRIRSKPQNPLRFRVQTEIKIGAQRPMRYKFKLYSADDTENTSLNNYVFCQLKEERLVGSFAVSPPTEGLYYFKIYARPEWEMYDDTTLRNVVIFLLDCERARRYITPFPLNEVPWGPTHCFYDFGMKLINQSSPVMVTWGGKRRLTIQMKQTMLVAQQLFDANGCEIDAPGVVQRDDLEKKINYYFLPPRTGYYKFQIFAMPKPKQKGKWKIPLVATFLIDCKQTKNPIEEDIPVPTGKPPGSRRKVRVPTVR